MVIDGEKHTRGNSEEIHKTRGSALWCNSDNDNSPLDIQNHACHVYE